MTMSRVTPLLLVAICLFVPPTAQAQSEPATLFEPFEAKGVVTAAGSAALTQHPVRVRRDRMTALVAGQRVLFPISAEERWEGTVQRVEHRGQSVSLFGVIDGSPQGQFVFTVDPDGLMATILLPEKREVANLRSLGGDEYLLRTFDGAHRRQLVCG